MKLSEPTYNELHKLLGTIAWWADDNCTEAPNSGDLITIAMKAQTLLKKLEDESEH